MPEATIVDRVNVHLEIEARSTPTKRYKTYQSTMALPLPLGLTPNEVAFLCEMEMITVISRQRLESLNLLSVGPLHNSPTPQSNTPRAQHPLSDLLIELPYHYGSPSS